MSGPGALAFVIPHPYVDALACFREPIRYLAEHGWHVDLYTSLSPAHPAPFFGSDRIHLVPIEMTRAGAVALIARLTLRRPKYRWIITVPQWGLHYAGTAARLAGIPMGCISDELKAETEATSDEKRRWKARERRAHQRCAWTMALSAERAAFIRDENRLGPAHPIFVVPNAPAGRSQRLASRYFQDVLGLPAASRLLLHAGSLWWKEAEALIGTADRWPSDWVVVFQERFQSAPNGHRDSARIRFAGQVLPAAVLDYAVSSAAIGLALYDDASVNNRLMGTASGKVSLYLKNELPVIATRAGGFDWLEREGCGVCIDRVHDVPAAAERIWADYDSYARAARRQFDSTLEFGANFRPIAEFLAR
jgi:hypothetical protein